MPDYNEKNVVISTTTHTEDIYIRNKFTKKSNMSNPGIEILYPFENYECIHVDDLKKEFFDLREHTKCIICIFRETKYEDPLVELLKYRIKHNLPYKIIWDESHEGWTDENKFLDILTFFEKHLNVDVQHNVLFILNSQNGVKEFYEYLKKYTGYKILLYNWASVDAWFWKNYKPEKFTDAPLKDRLNLINLIVSKGKTKPYRTFTAYQFFLQGLMPNTLLSIAGNIEEYEIYDDPKFTEYIKNRMIFIGEHMLLNVHGYTNSENGSETSNKIIYTNTRLSCILESSGCYIPELKGVNTFLNTDSRLTEKFYRNIVNRTPYVVIGGIKTYKLIKEQGFHTFENILGQPSFEQIYSDVDCKSKIIKLTTKVKEMFDILPSKIDEIQSMVNENYVVWEKEVQDEYKIYKEVITQFLNTE